MAPRNYTIEIRTDFNDKSRDKLALHIVRQAAHQALTTVMLLADGRKPQVVLHTSDMFQGTEELELFDPDAPMPEDETPTEEATND